MTKASIIFDSFSDAHKIVDYLSEVLADSSVKSSKKNKSYETYTKLKSHKLYCYTY